MEEVSAVAAESPELLDGSLFYGSQALFFPSFSLASRLSVTVSVCYFIHSMNPLYQREPETEPAALYPDFPANSPPLRPGAFHGVRSSSQFTPEITTKFAQCLLAIESSHGSSCSFCLSGKMMWQILSEEHDAMSN